MPEISSKGRSMPESPIRKLVPFAEEAKNKGIKVFHEMLKENGNRLKIMEIKI